MSNDANVAAAIAKIFLSCRPKLTCMNYLIVHRPTRDPLPSNAGRATALAMRYV